ncbi:hypothetical protein [Kitasatospora aureofaciens]|uniref:hypothetical protein n=1 Tax=Kitasatospora aureofaciens TaxID=1894 RepID=UPI001C4732DA|nr:hypothetical protein [Kitasatospora aureofaciens]MBV6696879.1 hypothetical protein [Kitasatospora aureofaciens]
MANAVVHLILVPSHLEEKLYIGALFVVGSVVMLGVAVGLVVLRRPVGAWLVGSATSVGMIVGFLLSRTVGLPGYHEDGWELPYGPLSLVVEALFVVLFAAWLGRADTVRGAVPHPRVVRRIKALSGRSR